MCARVYIPLRTCIRCAHACQHSNAHRESESILTNTCSVDFNNNAALSGYCIMCDAPEVKGLKTALLVSGLSSV